MEEVAGKERKKENKEKENEGYVCGGEKKREKEEENMDKKIK